MKNHSTKNSLLLVFATVFLFAAVLLSAFTMTPRVKESPKASISYQHQLDTPFFAETKEPTQPPTQKPAEPKMPKKYRIKGVPVHAQGGSLGGACETFACTMLLNSYGFKITEQEFVDKYLLCIPVGGSGPDMNCAYAGHISNGYGVYSPAMAKFMNKYLTKTKSKLRAYSLEGKTLAQLTKKYVIHGTPVMVWGTTGMCEPSPGGSWTVDYVDENAKYKKGETITWPRGEHCLVLIGYDTKKYYFADSCAAAVSSFDKKLCEKRYKQLGRQAIVLEEY